MQSAWTSELIAWMEAEARRCGFDQAGVATIEGTTDPVERRDAERFAAWIAAGHAGEMEYLKRRDAAGDLLRSSVQVPMPWARSVVVCAVNYFAKGPLSLDPAEAGAGWIARYAWSGKADAVYGELTGSDYHDDLLERLCKLEAKLQERTGAQTRCYVDTGPVVERSLAARAGVGWVGKNTCVLNQELGSWLLLATVVTSLPVAAEVVQVEAADRCGSCTRCIEACPTEALIAPREMDASRCISYLTIEKKGEIPEELRAGMGRQIFGCDICQEVCPWNRRAPIADKRVMRPRRDLVNADLGELGRMEPPEFRRRFHGSPMERTGLKRLRRNVAVAMGNSGEARFREQLARWEETADPVLTEAASWALRRIAKRHGGDVGRGRGAEETARRVARGGGDSGSASISKVQAAPVSSEPLRHVARDLQERCTTPTRDRSVRRDEP